MTRNQVAVALKGKITRSGVYAYLSQARGRDLSSDAIGHLMNLFGLTIEAQRQRSAPKRKTRPRV